MTTGNNNWKKALELFEEMYRAYVFSSADNFRLKAIELGDFIRHQITNTRTVTLYEVKAE